MLHGWFSEKAKKAKKATKATKATNIKLNPKPSDIFYTNTTGEIVEVTIVTKTTTLNKDNYRWDDTVYMGELVSQARYKPTTPIAVGTANDA